MSVLSPETSGWRIITLDKILVWRVKKLGDVLSFSTVTRLKRDELNGVNMTKTLLLLRHGKSSWKDESLPDIKRPLKKRGEEASEEIGKLLKKHKLLPDLILTSPAKRAKSTAEIAAKEAGISKHVEVVDGLYMAEVKDIFKALAEMEGSHKVVMVVGHNPGLEAVLQVFSGHVDSLPTGALACLRLEIDDWKAISMDTAAELVHFWNPEEEKKETEKDHKKDDKKSDEKDHKKSDEKDHKKDHEKEDKKHK